MSTSDTRIVVVGSVNADLHLTVDRLPAAGATVLADHTRWLPGGKGANQAAAAARLGAAVSLVAAVGDDATADVALGGLAETGVTLDHVRRIPDTATGVAVVCVDAAGENLIVVSPGANAALGSADVVLGAGCAAVLVSLEIPTATAGTALAGAHQAGALAVLNAAPADRVTPALLAAADILVANAGEAAALAAEHDGDLAALARAAGTTVVATAGGDAVRAVAPDGTEHVVAARTVEVVDTVGAGDCFAAALTVALVEHAEMDQALRFAAAAAGLKVGRLGARSVPTRSDVETFLAAAPLA
ncbi:MAG TPA: PfkB family carbohydrate kinase [Acidimicrobiales bacterium]|nr:PfkB family carbohydrate kinase [Acidimicrobiales bacterium]